MITCGQCGFGSEQPFTYCPSCGTHSAGRGGSGFLGQVLNGKYRVLSELGAGSMGTVYLGEHVALKKRIALKVLHRELQVGDEPLRRFQREGIAAGQVNHANAIQIFDFDRTEQGTCFLAMEYVEGENLKQLLAREGSLAAEVALSLMRQLLGTLAEAHRHGIVHRDLKPENLMVARAADGELTLKVLDFGLSKLVDRGADSSLQTLSGRVMGTPLYMAPEQWHGEEVDQRSDLYSAALILYELLTGHQPFKGGNVTETLMRSTTEAPPSLLDRVTKHPVPIDLDAVLRTALAKERDERFQSATEMMAALDAVRLDRVQVGSGARRKRPTRAKTSKARSAPQRRHGRTLVVVAAAAVAAVALLLLWLSSGEHGARAEVSLVRRIPPAQRDESQRGYLLLLDEARDRLRTGELALAMASATKALHQPVADAEALVVRARIYHRQRDYDAAMLDCVEAQKRLPDYAAAATGIGWLLLERGDLAGAEQRFRAAMQMDETCGEAHAGIGAVLVQRHSATEALRVLDPAARQFDDEPLVHLYRGEAQLASDQLDAAVQSFLQAKRSDPSLWQAYRGLALAYDKKGNAAAAEQQCSAGLQMVHDATDLRVLQAELLLTQDRFDEALTVLAAAGTKSGHMLVLEGIAQQGRGNGKAAVESWTKALDTGLEQPARVHLLLAMQHAMDGNQVEAAHHAEQATVLDDTMAPAFFHWGLAAFRQGDYPAAAFHFERAVELDGTDLVARHSLGVLYMDYLQRPDDAVVQFRAYRDGGGPDPKVQEWLRTLAR